MSRVSRSTPAGAPLVQTLDGYADLAQGRWTAWRLRNAFDHLPERFGTVLDEVVAFADPGPCRRHRRSIVGARCP